MKVLSLPSSLLAQESPSTVLELGAMTLGVFDGLHLGHRHLIDTMLKMRRTKAGMSGPMSGMSAPMSGMSVPISGMLGSLPAALVTFDEHPRGVLTGQAPVRLLDPRIRNRILEAWGLDWLVILETNTELLGLQAESFLERLLKILNTQYFIVGPNFMFGRGRKGNAEMIRRKLGERAIVLESVFAEGETASATLVRTCLARADLARAHRVMGRPYSVMGTVEKGDGLGRALGSPTLNLTPPPDALPDGVYAVTTPYGASVAHLGPRPTLGKMDRRFEVHVLDPFSDNDVSEIEVSFAARLRDVQKFDSADALKAAIASDIAAAKKLLG